MMKNRFLFAIIMYGTLLAKVSVAQSAPIALSFTVNSTGDVVLHTADPYAVPSPEGRPRRDPSDSVIMTLVNVDSPTGRKDTVEARRNGALSKFNFTNHTLSRPVNSMQVYPYRQEAESGVWREQLNDSSFVYRYTVHGWVCSNGGEYSFNMHEEWNYRSDGTLKEVVSHNRLYTDTNSTVYRYEWWPTRKLKSVTKISSLLSFRGWLRDTTTLEMVYDGNDQLIAQAAYAGPAIDSLTTSIQEWKAALTKDIARSYLSGPKAVDRNGVKAQFLITYTYEHGRLTNCLAYDENYTGIRTDTLEYNEKLLLVSIKSRSLDNVHTTHFTYKNRRLTSKKEGEYYVPREGYEGSNLGPYTETYSYDSQDRIRRIDFEGNAPSSNGSKTFSEIKYK